MKDQGESMNEPKKISTPEKDGPTIDRVFLGNELLPDIADAFLHNVPALSDAIKSANVVVDTNVLLLPLGAGAGSLTEIIAVYKKLSQEKRLFMPAQVAREFMKNRPTKIGELQQGLSDKLSRFAAIDSLSYPILEGLPEYEALNKVVADLGNQKKALTKATAALVSKIRTWEWSDPVSNAYKTVFTNEIILDVDEPREHILAELRRRYELTIPPGYKDSSKDDLGIGDYLIWKTILKLGNSTKKNLVFVSGDEKADWQHRAGNTGFLPRFELLDEYRRASGGMSFYMIPLSKLLELLKAKQESVQEIKKEENRLSEAVLATVQCSDCQTTFSCNLGEFVGASAMPTCPNCAHRFHVHRTSGGLVTHEIASKPSVGRTRIATSETVEVECPACNAAAALDLATFPGATSWWNCGYCGTKFPIHRGANGSVFVGGRYFREPLHEPRRDT